jgi:hypothetical protein
MDGLLACSQGHRGFVSAINIWLNKLQPNCESDTKASATARSRGAWRLIPSCSSFHPYRIGIGIIFARTSFAHHSPMAAPNLTAEFLFGHGAQQRPHGQKGGCGSRTQSQ